jgi:hypothetical protein
MGFDTQRGVSGPPERRFPQGVPLATGRVKSRKIRWGSQFRSLNRLNR